jgi:hypothetical protein
MRRRSLDAADDGRIPAPKSRSERQRSVLNWRAENNEDEDGNYVCAIAL